MTNETPMTAAEIALAHARTTNEGFDFCNCESCKPIMQTIADVVTFIETVAVPDESIEPDVDRYSTRVRVMERALVTILKKYRVDPVQSVRTVQDLVIKAAAVVQMPTLANRIGLPQGHPNAVTDAELQMLHGDEHSDYESKPVTKH